MDVHIKLTKFLLIKLFSINWNLFKDCHIDLRMGGNYNIDKLIAPQVGNLPCPVHGRPGYEIFNIPYGSSSLSGIIPEYSQELPLCTAGHGPKIKCVYVHWKYIHAYTGPFTHTHIHILNHSVWLRISVSHHYFRVSPTFLLQKEVIKDLKSFCPTIFNKFNHSPRKEGCFSFRQSTEAYREIAEIYLLVSVHKGR